MLWVLLFCIWLHLYSKLSVQSHCLFSFLHRKSVVWTNLQILKPLWSLHITSASLVTFVLSTESWTSLCFSHKAASLWKRNHHFLFPLYVLISGLTEFNISNRKQCLADLDDSTLPHMQEALASKPHGNLLLFQVYNP